MSEKISRGSRGLMLDGKESAFTGLDPNAKRDIPQVDPELRDAVITFTTQNGGKFPEKGASSDSTQRYYEYYKNFLRTNPGCLSPDTIKELRLNHATLIDTKTIRPFMDLIKPDGVNLQNFQDYAFGFTDLLRAFGTYFNIHPEELEKS